MSSGPPCIKEARANARGSGAPEPADSPRYAAALRAIEALHENATGRLSAQILGEFVSATTGGRRPILTSGEALEQAALLADAFHVFDLTRMILLEALRGVSVHGFSYYDAQIWATARLNQVTAISPRISRTVAGSKACSS